MWHPPIEGIDVWMAEGDQDGAGRDGPPGLANLNGKRLPPMGAFSTNLFARN